MRQPPSPLPLAFPPTLLLQKGDQGSARLLGVLSWEAGSCLEVGSRQTLPHLATWGPGQGFPPCESCQQGMLR